MPSAELISDCRNSLGEGLCHDASANCLWWVDINRPSQIQRLNYEDGEVEKWQFKACISYAAPKQSGGLIVVSDKGLHSFDPQSGELSEPETLEPEHPDNRSNDSCVDHRGNLWVGTMLDNLEPLPDPGLERNSGKLHRISGDRSREIMLEGIDIPNALCFSPDGRTMYFADTPKEIIWAYDHDPENGSISNRREFATHERGVPDGATVDAQGCVWSARFGGSCVIRFTPKGAVDAIIEIPCSDITCCTFGGAALDTLYITSARIELDNELLAEQPQAGGLFAAKMPGVQGITDAVYAG